jgi:hypothetical protein
MVVSVFIAFMLLIPTMAWAFSVTLVSGTNVLLGKSGGSSSTTSRTNIFSPAAYADYKRFGNEPTVTVDRYPFPGLNTSATARCSGTATTCYKDTTYVSGPNGFADPHYSPFFKSDDLGQTFRVPSHVPAQGQCVACGGGGGDSYQAVGQLTHRVFFTDLPGPGCITMNISDDLGENWRGDNIGCGTSPGVIDDRNWVEADEYGANRNVYASFINFSNVAAPTLSLVRSFHDGETGTFVTDSVCNTLDSQVPALVVSPAQDSDPTACPDPADKDLQIAGPVVADKAGTSTRPPTHNLYIPFIRGTSVVPGLTAGPPWSLWVARSTDNGTTWTRSKIAELGDHNPANIFPDLVVDRGGNLYVTWSQTQGPAMDHPFDVTTQTGGTGLLGETDVYYSYSTNAGAAWAPPIDLTQSTNKSAVFPWLVAGDPGLVDIVYYQANTGLNPNVAFVDNNGNACDPSDTEADCGGNGKPNPSVWNVIFGQSNNALNPGSNFNNVQITDHPNHVGQICTSGLACSGDRDLGDFFTIDVDHLGAANVSWVDDNAGNNSDGRNKYSHQLSGSSVYKNQTIGLINSWPIKDHSVTDRSGDTTTLAGTPNGSCPGMDILGTSVNRSGELITVTMTLNATPDFAKAITCAPAAPVTGGLWGVEFWSTGADNPHNYYIGYRDNPPDGPPRVEAGRMENTNVTVTTLEFKPTTAGSPSTPSGSCFNTRPPSPCTITMTVNATSLGMKSGAGMYSITGLSTFQAGTSQTPPMLRVEPGNSEQSDATVAFDVTGTGTKLP